MPRLKREMEEVQSVKDRILQTAMELICEEGFQQLSMRRLATQSGMTAANIYNYYANKDEIYLGIQTQGFSLLYQQIEKAYHTEKKPLQQFRAMLRAYLDFGRNNPDYYEVMLNRNTPKYADYVGTVMEPAALLEKQTALKIFELSVKAFQHFMRSHHPLSDQDARYRVIQVWTALHGIVSLYNNRVLQEMNEDLETILPRILDDLVASALNQ